MTTKLSLHKPTVAHLIEALKAFDLAMPLRIWDEDTDTVIQTFTVEDVDEGGYRPGGAAVMIRSTGYSDMVFNLKESL